jgi:hypothetical protein
MSKHGGIALGLASGVLALLAVVTPIVGQVQKQAYRAPRAADGHP